MQAEKLRAQRIPFAIRREFFRFVTSALVAVCLFLVWAPGAPADQEYVVIYKQLPSSALVFVHLEGMQYAQGSGFLVDRTERLLVTNHHVVEDKVDTLAAFPVYEKDWAIVKREFYLTKAPHIAGKVVATDVQRDLAIIRLDSVPREVPELKLAADSPKVGERTHMLGNPSTSTRAWVYSLGVVRSVGVRKPNLDNGQKVVARMIEVTADKDFGSGTSGGPVVNESNELVGVMQSGALQTPQQKLCVDVTEVRAFLGETYRNLATAAIGRRDYARAVVLATRAVQANPNDPMAYNERGAASSYLDCFEQAVADYGLALRLDPKLARAYRNRASAYYHQGKYEEAIADCTAAIRLDSSYALAYLSRSKAYQKLNRSSEAKADYATAVQLDPSLK